MPSHTIFYSWQSDLPNSVNRGFIDDCLQRAIKDLHDDDEIKLDPCLDRDTSGVPGSPDIASTIFAKIENADLVVADVSFIDAADSSRRTPNPNVLVELGYAAGRLGWDRIICIFNRAYGSIDELPFDIRPRRVRAYELRESEDKAEPRKLLVGVLKADITSILHAPDQAEATARQALLSELGAELITIIIFGEERRERQLNPWLDSLRSRFSMSAENLRGLATNDVAVRDGLSTDLNELSQMLDAVVHRQFYPATWTEYQGLVEKAVNKAKSIKADHFDGLRLSDDSLAEARSALVTTRRQLDELATRAEGMIAFRSDNLQSEASQMGLTLLRLSYYDIDPLQTGLGERLRLIGRELHLIECMRIAHDGGRSLNVLVERIHEIVRKVGELVDQLPPQR